VTTSRSWVVGAVVTSVGVAYLAILKATTTSAEGDFFDSSFFWWGWVFLPSVAAGAAAAVPEGAGWWGWLVVAPQAVAVVVEGALLHDPDDGASFWPVGLMFVALLGFLASGAAQLGRAARNRSA
jgi:hypothetical protein